MNRAARQTNEALRRAARALALPSTASVRPRAPVLREHTAPPRSSFGPALAAPKTRNNSGSSSSSGSKRNFSSAVIEKKAEETTVSKREIEDEESVVYNCCYNRCAGCPTNKPVTISPRNNPKKSFTTAYPGVHPKAFGQPRRFSTVARSRAINTILNVVPQQTAIVVERLGKFHKVLEPGINLQAPWPIDRLAYEFSKKEEVFGVTPLQSITKDNMSITISGMVYLRVVDPQKTAYGVENYYDAVNKLAQSTMRTALGNLSLDQVLTSRDELHALIVGEMNRACAAWGVEILRYNITQLDVPHNVRESMEQLVRTNRDARAAITAAEGKATSARISAEGQKIATELESQAMRIRLTNEAEGRASAARVEAEGQAAAIRAVGDATAHALQVVAETMNRPGALDAAAVQLTKQYTEAFADLAKKTNSTIFLPTGQSPAEVVAGLTQVAAKLFNSRS